VLIFLKLSHNPAIHAPEANISWAKSPRHRIYAIPHFIIQGYFFVLRHILLSSILSDAFGTCDLSPDGTCGGTNGYVCTSFGFGDSAPATSVGQAVRVRMAPVMCPQIGLVVVLQATFALDLCLVTAVA
jgi:hypothetical protein